MLVSQPDTGEQALEITEELVRSGAIDVIVVDSVAALVPRAEIEGEMGDSFVGLHARLMSQALQAGRRDQQTNTIVIFINQLREKVGVMYGKPRGHHRRPRPEVLCDRAIDVRRIETLKNGSEIIGNRTRAKVVKNKMAPPVPRGGVRHHVRRGHLRIMGELIDLGVKLGPWCRRAARGTRWASASVRAATRPKQYLRENHPGDRRKLRSGDPPQISTS